MLKKVSPLFLALVLLTATLPQTARARQDKTNPATKPAPQEPEKKKKKGIFGKVKDKAEKVGKVAANVATGKSSIDPVALTLGTLFNDQLPLKLDAGSVYKEVPAPNNFNPIFIRPTSKSLNTPLPPGDYSFPVHAICTKDSVHVPGRGVGYKLAPLQGKQADALAALIARGDIAQVPHRTLQMIAWEIQASIPYGEMPKAHQAVIDRLIPEYKIGISGGFLQKVIDRYQTFAAKNSKILPLDKMLEQAGVGDTLRSLNRSRNIIREEAFDYERSQMRLYDPALGERVTPADPSAPSAWTELQPGVYAQIIIEAGWQGLNRLNVRVSKDAGKSVAEGGTRATLFLKAAYTPAQLQLEYPTIAAIFRLMPRVAMGVGVAAEIPYVVAGGLIAYSVATATQALIITLSVKDEEFETVYRVFGGQAQLKGESWTPINPMTVPNYRNAAGLPRRNAGTSLAEGRVRSSDIIQIKTADALDGNAGGLLEYKINPANVKIIKVTPLRPPL